jgi:PAS domain S-box-containing protein
MLWLYLLGAVTVLVIALRRVLRRQKPLDDELYSKKVAIDHVQSGVAWVRADGAIGFVNRALAAALNAKPEDLQGHDWLLMFPQRERARIREAYSNALLLGITTLEARAERTDGSLAYLNLVLVAVHDHKMRFVGHQCLAIDRTLERELQEQVRELTEALARADAANGVSTGPR